ncbi:DSBA-like thioredoxin domain-containing protein [Chytriomyces sp. MP71]|nr:DSBA-like thioredoxin domain-containing protein [Chytriomyces sp. MP71]
MHFSGAVMATVFCVTTLSSEWMTAKLELFFDIVCPYAYLASQRLGTLPIGSDQIEFTPVLLGGIYALTAAPQGKAGSATDAMNVSKAKVMRRDFQRTVQRANINLNWHPLHPVKSLNAMRLLAAVTDRQVRSRLAMALFRAYWVDNLDISDTKVLLTIVKSKLDGAASILNETTFTSQAHTDTLRANTARVVSLGAPGVPFFHLPTTVHGDPASYWGGDRIHFVHSHLNWLHARERGENPLPPPVPQWRRVSPSALPLRRERTLVFFWDFSSPWSYMAWRVVRERLQPLCGPLLNVMHVPFLVGGLFKELGSTNILGLPPVKAAHMRKDMADWCTYWDTLPYPGTTDAMIPREPMRVVWPEVFPIRSILASRVAILCPKTMGPLFDACWRDNRDVSQADVIMEVLREAKLDGADEVVARARGDEGVKKVLWENGERASRLGLFGVPSFVVCDDVVWGQDRIMDVIVELRCGVDPLANTPVERKVRFRL